MAFSFVQCKALELCHTLHITHKKAWTQNTPKDVLGISVTHTKNFSGNSAKGMSPRFSFLLAVRQGPAGVVPLTGTQNSPRAAPDRLRAQSSSCDGLCTCGLATGHTWECWPCNHTWEGTAYTSAKAQGICLPSHSECKGLTPKWTILD